MKIARALVPMLAAVLSSSILVSPFPALADGENQWGSWHFSTDDEDDSSQGVSIVWTDDGSDAASKTSGVVKGKGDGSGSSAAHAPSSDGNGDDSRYLGQPPQTDPMDSGAWKPGDSDFNRLVVSTSENAVRVKPSEDPSESGKSGADNGDAAAPGAVGTGRSGGGHSSGPSDSSEPSDLSDSSETAALSDPSGQGNSGNWTASASASGSEAESEGGGDASDGQLQAITEGVGNPEGREFDPESVVVDGDPSERCYGIKKRLAIRRAWLKERREDQYALGGAPNAQLGIADATWRWCEAHPKDPQCNLPPVTVFFTTEELSGGQTPEEYDRHIILMKRQLADCMDNKLFWQ